MTVRHVYDGDLECIAFENFAPRSRWKLGDLYARLNRARRKLNDRAPFLHPWRVADVVDDNYRFRTLRIEDLDDSIPLLPGEEPREPCEPCELTTPLPDLATPIPEHCVWDAFPGEQPLAPP